MKFRYARVTTQEQNLGVQLDQLREYGCEKIYSEKEPGGNHKRSVMDEMFRYLRPNDTVVVVKLDRFLKSLKELLDPLNSH